MKRQDQNTEEMSRRQFLSATATAASAAALDAGRSYNEGDYGISSTMTAILGRMATYSGQVVKWDEAMQSNTDLQPDRYAWGAQPRVKPGPGNLYACAMPGQTKPY